ncbi:amino acid permease [Streptomyces sp. SCA3-4]|uniref:amino acid permease n=1 Tax=Streptomyces sichuanensis TaxID=2871810 RepID=UPI001CE26740|nr:amino acid permease [Streptomyces sichuanensis]MCA6095466.1 amino acid permease [Streptomyces sichuanensis]
MTMLALGGVIGGGLFVGSGAGIRVAGPGILLSYLVAAGLAILVMRMLGEMAAAMPSSGSFSVYAEKALGKWAGFTVGWLYWGTLCVAIAAEATAASKTLNAWLPMAPQWAFTLAIMLLFTALNLLAVSSFGEFEFWFAGLKVAAIIIFLGLGVAAIAGVMPSSEAPGFTNLTGHGGFLPHGTTGVITGVLAVLFSFGGLEVVTIAAAESANPSGSVARAVRSAVFRILVFYVGSIGIIVTLLPWDSAVVGRSPFVAMLDQIGVPAAAHIMDVVILLALLSSLNASMYGASRMLYSLAGRRIAPAALTSTSANGTPRPAVAASAGFGFFAVLLNYWWPDTVFQYLLESAGGALLVVWITVSVSQVILRRRLERETPHLLVVRMWGFPYLSWLVIAAMGAILLLMCTDAAARTQLLATLSATMALVVIAFVRSLFSRRRIS